MIMDVPADFGNPENIGCGLPVSSTAPNEHHGQVQMRNMWNEEPPSCSVCGTLIYDRTMLSVKDKLMHSACLRCTSCNQEVTQICFSDGNEVYCQNDFYRIFGGRCAGCLDVIDPTESVQRANQNIYHQGCFSCAECHKLIRTGDRFYLRDDNKLLCDADFDKLLNDDPGSVESDSDESTNNKYSSDRNSGISYQQLKYLRHVFKSNPRPPRHIRRQISAQIGLDTKSIQIWFQNKRSKDRRRRLKTKSINDSGLASDLEDVSGPFLKNDVIQDSVKTGMNSQLQEWLKNLDSLAVDAVPPNVELKVSDFRPNGEISLNSVGWGQSTYQEQFWFQRQSANTMSCNWVAGM